MPGWEDELERWLMPFLDRLGHKTRQRMCPLYVAGLIGPGDRKSVQPMAERLAMSNYDQLHHFITDGVWDATPLETELLNQADRLVGGRDAVLVIDDTSLPKKGERSVGVAAQYASALGKTANCQTVIRPAILTPYCRICECYRDGAIADDDPMSIDRSRQMAFPPCSTRGAVVGSGPT